MPFWSLGVAEKSSQSESPCGSARTSSMCVGAAAAIAAAVELMERLSAAGVAPDLLCISKGLTGGYLPLAATLATGEIYRAFLGRYEEFKTFFHGHSYTANPLGCAAAIATLSIFEREEVLPRVSRLSETMARELAELSGHRNVGEIRRKGLMAGIEIVADRGTRERFPAGEKIGQRVVRKVRERGVILRPLGDVIVLMPPLSSSESEIEFLVRSAAWAIEAVLGGGHS